MAGIRPPDNAAPAAPPESTEGKQCTLFVLRSQYVLFEILAGINPPTLLIFRLFRPLPGTISKMLHCSL
jgi:hypothetical protein